MIQSWWPYLLLAIPLIALVVLGGSVAYVLIFYGRYICRNIERKPLFLTPSGQPHPDGEEVPLAVGRRQLIGTYLRTTAPHRVGTIVFCHEFGGSRWLWQRYLGPLRDRGFDIFTFDFCNHGESETIVGYDPLHWTTWHEVRDVQAAIRYVQNRLAAERRQDRGGDSAAGTQHTKQEKLPIGIFGVSRGGGVAVMGAALEPAVQAIATEAAFPNHGTVTEFEMKWVGIYVPISHRWIYENLPYWFYLILCHCTLLYLQVTRNVKYPRIESYARRLANRPVFMIHGGGDNYITPTIVERFFKLTKQPAENRWCVPRAKHNQCLERAGDAYYQRLAEFFTATLGPFNPAPVTAVTASVATTDAPAASSEPPLVSPAPLVNGFNGLATDLVEPSQTALPTPANSPIVDNSTSPTS